jgi:hypothetical protein
LKTLPFRVQDLCDELPGRGGVPRKSLRSHQVLRNRQKANEAAIASRGKSASPMPERDTKELMKLLRQISQLY